MPTSSEYDAILARKMREREEGNKGKINGIINANILHPKQIENLKEMGIERPTDHPSGYVTKSGRVYKSRPGRKPKVKT